MGYFGFNFDKVPMPEHCPVYYWLELHKAHLAQAAGRFHFREASFLDNPRTPRVLPTDVGTLKLCPRSPCLAHAEAPAGDARRLAAALRRLAAHPLSGPRRTSPNLAEPRRLAAGGPRPRRAGNASRLIASHAMTSSHHALWAALAALEPARVLRVQHVQWLVHRRPLRRLGSARLGEVRRGSARSLLRTAGALLAIGAPHRRPKPRAQQARGIGDDQPGLVRRPAATFAVARG
jgi:hypothetical protein